MVHSRLMLERQPLSRLHIVYVRLKPCENFVSLHLFVIPRRSRPPNCPQTRAKVEFYFKDIEPQVRHIWSIGQTFRGFNASDLTLFDLIQLYYLGGLLQKHSPTACASIPAR